MPERRRKDSEARDSGPRGAEENPVVTVGAVEERRKRRTDGCFMVTSFGFSVFVLLWMLDVV